MDSRFQAAADREATSEDREDRERCEDGPPTKPEPPQEGAEPTPPMGAGWVPA